MKPKTVVTSSSVFWNPGIAWEANETVNELVRTEQALGDEFVAGVAIYKAEDPIISQKGPLGWARRAAVGLLDRASSFAAEGIGGSVGGSLAWGLKKLRSKLSPYDEGLPVGNSIQHSQGEAVLLEFSPNDHPKEVLREMAMANMSLYPQARHIHHSNGHGRGNRQVAGLNGKDIDEALNPVADNHRRFNISIYETCYSANLEMLLGQSEVTQYAIAFEDQVAGSSNEVGRIPLAEMMSVSNSLSSDREATLQMTALIAEQYEKAESAGAPFASVPHPSRERKSLREARKKSTDSTISAIDLDTLRSGLSPALDRLGRALSGEAKEEKRIQNLIERAQSENALEKSGDLVDLGGFLGHLHGGLEAAQDSRLKELIEKTQLELSRSLISVRTGEKYPLSGLSFHSKPELKISSTESKPHDESGLPEGWTKFVSANLGRR